MSIASFILPNWNLGAMAGLILVVFGIFVFWIAKFVGFKAAVRRIRAVGVVLVISGIAYWLGVSMIQDIFSDVKLLAGSLIIVLLMVLGWILFWPAGKKK